MSPAPGERLLRFVGDRVRFSLRLPHGCPPGARAFLRTNIGNAVRLRKEIIETHSGRDPLSIAFWRDVPLKDKGNGEWSIEIPLVDVGFWRAKAYMVDRNGRQHWPEGPDAGISVHPDSYRTSNTIYCAFTRMFGPNKKARNTQDDTLEKELNALDKQGYTVIPPSGKFRDLIAELDHIIGKLGCRVLHLLPINPTPTTYARMGRFGSPYACEDLISVDPALVEFDECTTGVDQFCELAHEVHRRGGRIILDMVINHTGWGSRLQEMHPEWFLRTPEGDFASPGAWGVKWGDLVELDPRHVELWDELAQAFVTWCRRGVDGFRCDAGYKVPVQVWQYIEARVRQEFPEALFLLEGLGGPLEATENLLTEGGMQWAYSELFQNFTGAEVSRYLDYSQRQSERVGVYVHYSETHDNNRLAWNGRAWSLMRNQLCALASVSGGFGFTCGVEWLAPEKVNVHSSRGLCWGAKENIINELSLLNRLLWEHPCFFDGAKLTRLSPPDSAVYALRRDSAEGLDRVLVLVNTDVNNPHELRLDDAVFADLGRPQIDLLGQVPLEIKAPPGKLVFMLPAGAAYCLATTQAPAGLSGEQYRRQRAQAAWGLTALAKVQLPERIGPYDWRELARRVDADPYRFLASLSALDPLRSSVDLLSELDTAAGRFPKVVVWTLLDRRRITPVPPDHWILVQDPRAFEVTLKFADGTQEQARSIEVHSGHVAYFAPRHPAVAFDAELNCRRFALTSEYVTAMVRFLASGPAVVPDTPAPPADSVVLLTNSRGGMARIRVDLGRVDSKYDCALAANLHPEFPVDRHVFVKRVRAWINADGFITPLNLHNLVSFEIGPPAAWNFLAEAGNGRTVAVQLTADMMDGWNTTVFRFQRPAQSDSHELPPEFSVHLVVRVDIEDRNFHAETQRNPGADLHFTSKGFALDPQTGFAFTPELDRQLQVYSDTGFYHPQPEWSQGIAHIIEQQRGQTGWGDAYSPGWFELPLNLGEKASVALSADIPTPTLDLVRQATAERQIQNTLALTRAKFPPEDLFGRQLVLAARSFLAKRGTGGTIIAGYPWFLDWGRDSFIAARGLLAAGMVAEVAELIIVFGRFSQNGTMPNTIHGNDASNRDTSDAPLWYGVLVEDTAARMTENLYQVPVDPQGRTVLDVLRETALGYRRGTPNGIRMDEESGLIWSPPHFTWMDTNYPACTPREGYPVEIQVLWIHLLRQLDQLKAAPDGNESWKALADRAEASLKKYFWLEDCGYIADLLIAKPGVPASKAVVDNALRSNYLLAIVFKHFSGEQARRAVDAAQRYLVIPGALRTLAPLPVSPPLEIRGRDGYFINNPAEPYWGRYEGDEDTRRKPAYHNGTAWTWTFPIFCEALVEAWDYAPGAIATAKAYLASVDQSMMSGCLGQIPEILDGDAPHQQRGCDAQAWGVTENLRVWAWLNKLRQ